MQAPLSEPEPMPNVFNETIEVLVGQTTMSASIKAQLGFQGYADFLVSLSNSDIFAYASDCINCTD